MVVALAGLVGRIYESSHLYVVAQKRSMDLAREIVGRQAVEAALKLECDRAQRYLDTADVILLALDLGGKITLINRKGCAVLGWAEHELIGADWIETCLPLDARPAVRRHLDDVLSGHSDTIENLVLTHAGEERLIEWHNIVLRDEDGDIVGTFSSGGDITERRRLEGLYQQAQKMDAIGRLVGGVAHDFNNLLTVIQGFSSLLLLDPDPDSGRQSDIQEIYDAGMRAEALTRQLLAFSRKQLIAPVLLDLNVVLREMGPMLSRLIREDVRIAMRVCDVALLHADRGQIEQIVVNLVVNARDAMPTGGTVTIATASVELANLPSAARGAKTAENYVSLVVSDTGSGMTPQVQAHVFEPFFTTKEPSDGTGLGLATVHDIVMRSNG